MESGLVAAAAGPQQGGWWQQGHPGDRDERSPHAKLAASDLSHNASDSTVGELEANRLTPVQDLGAIAAGIDEVRPERGLLRPRPATESTVAAVAAAPDVTRNRAVPQAKLLEAALEDRIRPIPGALVGVDVEPGFDGAVMRVEVIVDAERPPLIANGCGQAK